MKKNRTVSILALVLAITIPLVSAQTAYAAPDFSGCYIKEHPNEFTYYNSLDGKTIVFNKYDPTAELYEGESQPYNYYELAYWNPDECDITSTSSNPSVADVDDMCELYGSADDDGGYYTSVIEARKKGTTTITVTEKMHDEYLTYDEDGNEIYEGPTVSTFKFKVIVTDKWYSGRLHYKTKIKHSKVFPNTKRMKVTIKNAYKGDKVTIKVGKNKTITKKIKKNKKKVVYTIKFKRQAAGRNVSIKIYDKYGKKVRSSSNPVYYTNKIRQGLTKKQVKLTPGWGIPDNTDSYGQYTTWWYGNYNKHVYFKNGRVTGWGK